MGRKQKLGIKVTGARISIYASDTPKAYAYAQEKPNGVSLASWLVAGIENGNNGDIMDMLELGGTDEAAKELLQSSEPIALIKRLLTKEALRLADETADSEDVQLSIDLGSLMDF